MFKVEYEGGEKYIVKLFFDYLQDLTLNSHKNYTHENDNISSK